MTDPVQSVILMMMKGQGLLRIISLLCIAVIVSGCQINGSGGLSLHSGQEQPQQISEYDEIVESLDGLSPASSYLVADRASRGQNMAIASKSFNDVLASDPNNHRLIEMTFRAYYLNGDIEEAAALASTAQQSGINISFGSEPALVKVLEQQDWSGALAVSDLLLEDEGSYPLGIVMGAWSLALQNQGDAGLTRLLELARDEQNIPYVIFTQSALISEFLGRPVDAVASAEMALDHNNISVTGVIAMAGILVRQGFEEKAKDVLSKKIRSYFNKPGILKAIDDGTSPLFIMPDIYALLAEGYIDASAIPTQQNTSRLARLHAAAFIDPDNDQVNYLLGLYYRDLDQIDRGIAYHAQVSPDGLWRYPVEFLKARYLSDDPSTYPESLALFESLTAGNPENLELWVQMGNSARYNKDYDTALRAYDEALRIDPIRGLLHYYRGITLDRLDRKADAEAALRESITHDANNAYALNYLGYWLLIEGGDAEEALGFIRTAIEKQPRNGYFMDSLGWGYYKLGRLRQALIFMERAVELLPVDPLITAHLGDVYAAMDRHQEAIFQWQRALDLVKEGQRSDELDLAEIQNKIKEYREKLN